MVVTYKSGIVPIQGFKRDILIISAASCGMNFFDFNAYTVNVCLVQCACVVCTPHFFTQLIPCSTIMAGKKMVGREKSEDNDPSCIYALFFAEIPDFLTKTPQYVII